MLKKLSISIILLLAVCIPSFSQCPSQDPYGIDPPTNITLNGQCLVPNSTITLTGWAAPGQEQLCFNTVNPADTAVSRNYNVNQSYSGPTAYAVDYDNAFVSGRRCITLDNLMPGKIQALVIADCDQGGTGGKFGMNCSRFSSKYSSAGYPANQHHGFMFKTPGTNPNNTFVMNVFPKGPPQVFQGHPINVDLIHIWIDGPQPSNIFYTSLQVDGVPCHASTTGTPCGNTGISLILDASGGEIPNNGANGYNVLISNSGAYAGDYYVSSSFIPAVLGQPGSLLRIVTSSTTTIGQHQITGVEQATNSSLQSMGSPVTFTYSFNVLAPLPAFVATPPTTFPTILGLGKWNTTLATIGVTDYLGWQSANLTPPNKLNNDNLSGAQSANNPFSIWNYGGAGRIPYQFADYFNVTTPWQAGHFYNIGDMFAGDSCTLVVTTQGTSGSSSPVCPVVGQYIRDGAASEFNAGSKAWWYLQAQRGAIPVINWALNMSKYSTWMEWNDTVTWDISDDMYRQGGQLSENCNPSGCTGMQKKALIYLTNPLIKTTGINVNSCIWSYKFVQADTNRSQPYCGDNLVAASLATGHTIMNGSVDETQARVDLQLQYLEEKMGYNPVRSASNPYPGLVQAPNFDDGLGTEFLIHKCAADVAQGKNCDPRIPDTIQRWAGWYYLNEYQTSSHNTSYTPWLVPGIATASDLNMLNAASYAFVGAAYGNSLVPGTNVTWFQVADDMAYHSLDNGFYGYKDFTQVAKSWMDYYGWRTGMSALDSYVMPSHNPVGTLTPDKLEPQASASWPSGFPAATNVTNTGATITYYMGKSASCHVGVAIANSNGSCPVTFPYNYTGADAVFQTGTDVQWLCNVAVVNLPQSGTKYCFGVGGTDASGNVGFTSYNPANSPYAWTFTTTQGASLAVSVLPVSLTIQQNNNGSSTVTTLGTGGFNSSVTLTASGFPSGMMVTFNPVTIPAPGSGTSIVTVTTSSNLAVGTYPVTITASGGGLSPTAILTVIVTPSNPVHVVTTTLPQGTVGLPYNAQLAATGGVPPYKWSVLGTLPPGLTYTTNGAILGTPTTAGNYSFAVSACDSEVPARCALGNVSMVVIAAPLAIQTASLPNAVVGSVYHQQIVAIGGQPPYSFSYTGNLPNGLSMDGTGLITGTVGAPVTTKNVYTFTVTVTDAANTSVQKQLTITVVKPLNTLEKLVNTVEGAVTAVTNLVK